MPEVTVRIHTGRTGDSMRVVPSGLEGDLALYHRAATSKGKDGCGVWILKAFRMKLQQRTRAMSRSMEEQEVSEEVGGDNTLRCERQEVRAGPAYCLRARVVGDQELS